jgi:tetratricopeptide (TPR) repeat protein
MADDLYERYKEALRTGHVAVLRGALQDALKAYKLAAQIAPSRATPHTSMGGVLLRTGHLDEALAEYALAVEKSPHDEGALLGQAEAMTASGMRPEAALVLDHVAEIEEAAGRLPEASDTLRRALELHDDPERGKRHRALVRQIRFSAGDKTAEQKLARALRLRDEDEIPALAAAPKPGRALPGLPQPALSPTVAFAAFAAQSAPRVEQAAASPAAPEPEPAVEPEPAPEPAQETPPEPEHAPEPEPELEPEPEPVPARATAQAQPEPEPEPERAPELAFERGPVPQPQPVAVMADVEQVFGPVGPSAEGPAPSGDELLSAAEAADAAGDTSSLRSLLLWTARAYAREGRFEAGLDAAHRLLQRTPNDVDAHLALVELYLARQWDGLAADKLRLLSRLAEFNDDEATRQRLSVVASRAFPEDEALVSSPG